MVVTVNRGMPFVLGLFSGRSVGVAISCTVGGIGAVWAMPVIDT